MLCSDILLLMVRQGKVPFVNSQSQNLRSAHRRHNRRCFRVVDIVIFRARNFNASVSSAAATDHRFGFTSHCGRSLVYDRELVCNFLF